MFLDRPRHMFLGEIVISFKSSVEALDRLYRPDRPRVVGVGLNNSFQKGHHILDCFLLDEMVTHTHILIGVFPRCNLSKHIKIRFKNSGFHGAMRANLKT